MGVFTPGSHGSTFGGNPFGSSLLGLRALEVIEENRLAEHSAELGAYFMEHLKTIKESSNSRNKRDEFVDRDCC